MTRNGTGTPEETGALQALDSRIPENHQHSINLTGLSKSMPPEEKAAPVCPTGAAFCNQISDQPAIAITDGPAG